MADRQGSSPERKRYSTAALIASGPLSKPLLSLRRIVLNLINRNSFEHFNVAVSVERYRALFHGRLRNLK